MERGREEGRERQARLVALLVEARFGSLPDAIRQRIAAARPDELETVARRLLGAASLADLFGPP